jgi:hypothetical protein
MNRKVRKLVRIELIDGRLRAANRGSNGVAFRQRLAMHSNAIDDLLHGSLSRQATPQAPPVKVDEP